MGHKKLAKTIRQYTKAPGNEVTTAKKSVVMGTKKAVAKKGPKKVTSKAAYKTAFKDQPTPAERKRGITLATTVGKKRITAKNAGKMPVKKRKDGKG